MSLDLFLVKATTPTLDKNNKYGYEYLSSLGYDMFDGDAIDDIAVSDIKKVAIPYTVIYNGFNYDKIKECYGLEEVPEICGFGQNGFSFWADNSIFHIPNEDLYRFMEEQEKVVWVVKLDKIGQWKNDEDLSNFISSLIKDKEVENCGCYHITKEMLAEIDRYTSHMYDLEEYENDMIFYREWY